MPYSNNAKYTHNRQLPPYYFEESTFKTVPLSHTRYSGKKYNKKGALAIVGRLKKKHVKKHNDSIQSILIPK